MPPKWAERFVGIPYLDGGDSGGGADCYGLVRLVYREVRRVEAPSLARVGRSEASPGDKAPRWVKSDCGAVGDVVVFALGGVPAHCGVVVGRDLMLHAIRGRRSAIESYGTSMWAKRIAGYYRLEVPRG